MLLDLPVEILSEILILLDHHSILNSSIVSLSLSIPLITVELLIMHLVMMHICHNAYLFGYT